MAKERVPLSEMGSHPGIARGLVCSKCKCANFQRATVCRNCGRTLPVIIRKPKPALKIHEEGDSDA